MTFSHPITRTNLGNTLAVSLASRPPCPRVCFLRFLKQRFLTHREGIGRILCVYDEAMLV
jgi:hypothetical protein